MLPKILRIGTGLIKKMIQKTNFLFKNNVAPQSEKDYINQYRILYKQGCYTREAWYVPEISLFVEYLSPKSVLDYGCGAGVLLTTLEKKYPDIKFYGYDPAVDGRDVLPVSNVDLVINNDVLEHIPEEYLDGVLAKIASISSNVIFALHHALAANVLPNGQNAHCTIKTPDEYKILLGKYFPTLIQFEGRQPYLSMAVTFPVSPEVTKKYHEILEVNHDG